MTEPTTERGRSLAVLTGNIRERAGLPRFDSVYAAAVAAIEAEAVSSAPSWPALTPEAIEALARVMHRASNARGLFDDLGPKTKRLWLRRATVELTALRGSQP